VQGRGTVPLLAMSVAGVAVLVAGCGSIGQPIPARFSPTPATASSSRCGASQVTGQFWDDFPGMSKALEGITFTNISSTPCRLPGFPTALVLEDASGKVVPPVVLSNPSGTATSDTDFVDTGSASAPSDTSPFSKFQTGGVTVVPGAKAVIAMFGLDGIIELIQPGCLAAASGDQLAVYLTADQAMTVTIPSSPTLSGPGNPDGSVLFTCSALVVSPVLTWSQAKSVVGPPSSLATVFPQGFGAAP